ncbi:putative quinol monooxygenase [Bacillus pseudomycoides]|uniref:putative quinol monooxygenase n=1 Tax=Bacillus pseudomycoides TaxID=64104 RepID=UPI000BEDFD98|nr:putative quinol monooxygenase [Bacillus pseudomycoides]PEE44785.1 antibiotic biosynthesis monooxygenase [Bacillus pseudomycoides]PGA88690.1 antibiotic biosynthesis monooxygenase [Bacillus pseudomycoides]PHF44518.1 antibiotic biosynthesis monooxygenase [Bacillus pseudomycoides]
MIIIHAVFQVDPAKQQAFLEEIQPLIHGSREESGNVSYDLYKDTEKENVYTMVEVWQDAEAVASHNTSKHFTSFVSKANQFLTAPLDIKVYDGQPVK